jgi:hypothetical protein
LMKMTIDAQIPPNILVCQKSSRILKTSVTKMTYMDTNEMLRFNAKIYQSKDGFERGC